MFDVSRVLLVDMKRKQWGTCISQFKEAKKCDIHKQECWHNYWLIHIGQDWIFSRTRWRKREEKTTLSICIFILTFMNLCFCPPERDFFFLVLLFWILISEVIISTLDSRRIDYSSELKKKIIWKKRDLYALYLDILIHHI